jgi:hypothetical protein
MWCVAPWRTCMPLASADVVGAASAAVLASIAFALAGSPAPSASSNSPARRPARAAWVGRSMCIIERLK